MRFDAVVAAIAVAVATIGAAVVEIAIGCCCDLFLRFVCCGYCDCCCVLLWFVFGYCAVVVALGFWLYNYVLVVAAAVVGDLLLRLPLVVVAVC